MRNRPKQKISRQLLEGVIAIGLVLLFFFIIMSILNLLFPAGGGFSFFIEKDELEQVSTTLKRQHDLRLSRNGLSDTVDSGGEWAARLTATNNSVKSKRAVDIAWNDAETGMRLYNLDAVQTLDRSTALIHFDDQNEIDLGENSLIVIRRMEQDLIFREKRSYMVVVDGELRGRIGGARDDGVYLEVATPDAVTRMQNTAQSDVPLEFRINVEKDNKSTITLFSGEAEVEAEGETVTLKQNQMTRISSGAAPSAPVTVPKRITPKRPRNDQTFSFRSLPPRIRLAWQPVDGMTGYRLQLSRDREFRELLIDDRLQTSDFYHGNLRAGDYFWRVSGVRGEDEGAYSPVRHFSLVQDQQPPELLVQFPLPPVKTATAEVSGSSEQGSLIFINGQKIESHSNGDFSYRMPIARGSNVIVVEAVDPAGNISYSSKTVNGLY